MFGMKKIYGVLNDYFWDKSFILNLLLIVLFFVVLNLIIFLRFMDPNNLFLISLLKGDNKIIKKQETKKNEEKPTFLKINNNDNSFEVLNFKKEDFITHDSKNDNNRRMMSNLLL